MPSFPPTGAHLMFVIERPTCEAVVSAPLSSTINGTKQTELPARLVTAARNRGIGFTKLTNFLTELNTPPTMHIKSYQMMLDTLSQKAKLPAHSRQGLCAIPQVQEGVLSP